MCVFSLQLCPRFINDDNTHRAGIMIKGRAIGSGMNFGLCYQMENLNTTNPQLFVFKEEHCSCFFGTFIVSSFFMKSSFFFS